MSGLIGAPMPGGVRGGSRARGRCTWGRCRRSRGRVDAGAHVAQNAPLTLAGRLHMPGDAGQNPLKSAGLAVDGLPPLGSVVRELGLSARKSLGQHFILDLNLTRRIARAAGPLQGKTVVEV